MENDLTGKRLFFQLLHKARELWNWSWDNRHLYLEGMRDSMLLNNEDFTIADNMRDVWTSQRCGAE